MKFNISFISGKIFPWKIATDSRYLCSVSDNVLSNKTTIEILQKDASAKFKDAKKFVKCPKQHYTFEFLACDKSSDCWPEQHTEEDMKEQYRQAWFCSFKPHDNPPMFKCGQGLEQVSYSLVCDHQPDCVNGADESFCVYETCSMSSHFRCQNKQVIK